MTSILITRRKFGHRHRGNKGSEGRCRNWSYVAINHGLGRNKGGSISRGLRGIVTRPNHLWLPEMWEKKFLGFKPPSWWYFVSSPKTLLSTPHWKMKPKKQQKASSTSSPLIQDLPSAAMNDSLTSCCTCQFENGARHLLIGISWFCIILCGICYTHL